MPPPADAATEDPSRAGARQARIAVAALLLVWLAFVFPALGGKLRFPAAYAGPLPGSTEIERTNPELGDVVFATYQWRSYMTQRWDEGAVPLWDPHRFLGVPFAANIVTGTWYPPNWAYASGAIAATFSLLGMASMLGALLGAYWFLRLLRLHPYAACLGAIGFALSGFMVKWSEHESIYGSGMWLPISLGGMELVHRGRRLRGIAVAGVALALSVLAGHAQVALYVWYTTAAWAAVAGLRAWWERGAGRRRPGALAGAAALSAVPFTLAAGLAAIQIVPSAELAGRIIRQEYSFEEEARSALPPEHIPTFLIPDWRGSALDGNFAGPGMFYLETAVYPGVAFLPLAAAGLAHRRRRLTGFFGGMVVLGLLAMFATPLVRLLLLLPGLDRVWWLDRYVFFVNVGVACLAALGLDALLERRSRRLVVAVAATAGALAIVVAALTLAGNGVIPREYLAPRGARAALLLVAAAAAAALAARRQVAALALVAVAAADLWLWAFPLHPFHRDRPIMIRTESIEYLAGLPGPRARYANQYPSYDLAFNAAMHYRLYDAGGYDIAIPTTVVELLSVADPQDHARQNFVGPFTREAFASPIMDLLGVAAVSGPPNGPIPEGSSPARTFPNITISRRPGAFPAAFLAPCWDVLPPSRVLRAVRGATSEQLRTTALVADGDAARAALPPRPPAGCVPAATVDVTAYEPERVRASVRSTGGGVLVLTDTWFPGWQAAVDGRDAPLLEVDHALRGVYVGPGAHEVVFRYRPASFTAGAGISAASVVLLLAAGVAARRRASRRVRAPVAASSREPAAAS